MKNVVQIKIETLDLGLMRPEFASCHLLTFGHFAALVDVGSSVNAEVVTEALASRCISAANVQYIFVTHIHLDHAGGAGKLLTQAFPHAKLVVHPRGARHMQEPRQLEQAARSVYGDAEFDRSYGSLVPVPARRILFAEDQAEFTLGEGQMKSGKLRVYDTPGHARHHYCLWLENENCLFTGDTLGLSYPSLVSKGLPFLFPTTTPTAFDPAALHRSLLLIESLAPDCAFLTHFGKLLEPVRYLPELRRRLDAHVCLAREVAARCVSEQPLDRDLKRSIQLKKLLSDYTKMELIEHGVNAAEGLKVLELDIDLNVQGLVHWLSRDGRE